MQGKSIIVVALAVVAFIFASSAIFTVHQTKQALVLQFGEPKRAITEPGLKVKLPFVQNVLFYENRVLNLDPPVQRVLLADQKPLQVDAFGRYKIVDALRFYQSIRTETTAEVRLNTIVNASLRETLGNVTLASVLSDERADIMTRIRDRVNAEASRWGIDVVDVRIRRTDLPEDASQAVYERMKSERVREAAEFRAQGEEQKARIMAIAQREATVIEAEARREAEILRGEGEAERTRILNDAFGQNTSFFDFYRSMQAYEASLKEDNSLLIIPQDHEFFRYFENSEAVSGLKP